MKHIEIAQKGTRFVNASRKEKYLICSNLSKAIGDDSKKSCHHYGLQGIDLAFDRGDFICILGLSGSGKTMLTHLLDRHLEPSSGSVLIDGQNLAGLSSARLVKWRAEKVGRMFSEPFLRSHCTLRDNIAAPLEARGVSKTTRHRRADAMLERLGLTKLGGAYPDRLDDAGRQLVCLGRAFLADPSLLVLDDPFRHLAAADRTLLQGQLRALAAEGSKTIVMTTSQAHEAFYLGRYLVILDQGKIVQQDRPNMILRNPASPLIADLIRECAHYRMHLQPPIAKAMLPHQPIYYNLHDFLSPIDPLRRCLETRPVGNNRIAIYIAGKPVGLIARNDIAAFQSH